MKTPTPEEFLRDKYKLVDFHNLTINGVSWLELMRDYAEALYTDRIEKASNDLPSHEEIKNYAELFLTRNRHIAIDASAWMKQAASIVIAKYKSIVSYKKYEIKQHIKYRDGMQFLLKSKDKEIDRLKGYLFDFMNEDQRCFFNEIEKAKLDVKKSEVYTWNQLFKELTNKP